VKSLRLLAYAILAEGLDIVPMLQHDYPSIFNRLEALSQVQVQVRRTRQYLEQNESFPNPMLIADYCSFAFKVFVDIARYGRSNAQSYILADYNQYIAWGYDSEILKRVAYLQAVTIP
jgi:hypothetical protein